MVSNFIIQKYLRQILLNGLNNSTCEEIQTMKVFWSNVNYGRNSENPVDTSGLYIEEYFTPVSDIAYSYKFQMGSGFWRLLLYDDVGTGLRAMNIADQLCNMFPLGQHVIEDVNDSLKISIVIDSVSCGEMRYNRDLNKSYFTITINYRKIQEIEN